MLAIRAAPTFALALAAAAGSAGVPPARILPGLPILR